MIWADPASAGVRLSSTDRQCLTLRMQHSTCSGAEPLSAGDPAGTLPGSSVPAAPSSGGNMGDLHALLLGELQREAGLDAEQVIIAAKHAHTSLACTTSSKHWSNRNNAGLESCLHGLRC